MSAAVLSRVAPLALALALACAHARTAADAQQDERAAAAAGSEAEPSGDEARGSGSDAAKREDTTGESSGEGEGEGEPASGSSGASAAARESAGKAHGDDASDPAAAEDIDVATSPEALLQPGAQDKVREKLGLAKGSGSMSPALRRFQREHDLPATGMLDHETVEKLGLSPDEIFEK